MKPILFAVLIVFAVTLFHCGGAGESGKKTRAAVETPRQKTSYAIGYNMGKSLKEISADVEVDALLQGIRDAQAGTGQMPDEDIEKIYRDFVAETNKTLRSRMKDLAEKNKAEGGKFLRENAAREGVVTTASGLQYTVVREGSGARPTADDVVIIRYHGTLLDGTVFDSSLKDQYPKKMPMGDLIKGFSEALMLMKVGSKYKVFIPPDLAYGPGGAGTTIGPFAVLVFDVELVNIESK